MRTLFVCLSLGLLSAPAMASDVLPSCDAPAVIGTIIERQIHAERDTWHDGFLISAIDKPAEFQTPTPHAGTIAERHCAARALLPGNRHETLYYVISGGQGFAGIGWYVDYCVASHDYYRVYDADCRVLR